jgi:hypothetical protein
MEDKKPFYGEGEDLGRIRDVGTAQEVAILEKPARDREAVLKKEAETGLTEAQKANVEIMDGIEKKYPLACKKFIDGKGRKMLTLSVWGEESERFGLGRRVFMTREGFFSPYGDKDLFSPQNINYTELLDQISGNRHWTKENNLVMDKSILKDASTEALGDETFLFYPVDLTDKRVLSSLSYQLQQSQLESERVKREEGEKKVKLDPQTILSKL